MSAAATCPGIVPISIVKPKRPINHLFPKNLPITASPSVLPALTDIISHKKKSKPVFLSYHNFFRKGSLFFFQFYKFRKPEILQIDSACKLESSMAKRSPPPRRLLHKNDYKRTETSFTILHVLGVT
jgi:hypothetical protein